MTAVSDPTLTLTFEARVDRHSSTLALLVPWSAIDAVADELAGRETRNEAADPRIAAAVRRAVAGAEVVLRAEVAHVELAIDEVLALAARRPRAPGRARRGGRRHLRRGRADPPRPAGPQRHAPRGAGVGPGGGRVSPLDAGVTTDALMRLGASTAEAVAKALDAICPAPVERGDVTVVPGDESPFDGFPFADGPAVAVSVHYVDGVTGGNVLLMTARAARAIAAAMGGAAGARTTARRPASWSCPPSPRPPTRCSPPPRARPASCSARTSRSPRRTRACSTGSPPRREAFDATPHAVSATFQACGEACRLVQLVPNAFVVRMTRALGEQGTEQLSGDAGLSALGIARRTEPGEERALDDALRDIRVRVWAELGRTRVSLGAAPELPPGAVLELDRKADDPVDLYVNGLRFASGRLVLTDEGEWALRLEEVAGQGFRPPAIASESPPGDDTTKELI